MVIAKPTIKEIDLKAKAHALVAKAIRKEVLVRPNVCSKCGVYDYDIVEWSECTR